MTGGLYTKGLLGDLLIINSNLISFLTAKYAKNAHAVNYFHIIVKSTFKKIVVLNN